MEIKEILHRIQLTSTVHDKCIKDLEDIYMTQDKEKCIKVLEKFLIHAFQTDYKTNNPFLERFIDFYIKFIIKLEGKVHDKRVVELLDNFFEVILLCVRVDFVKIRYHACDFINKYLQQNENKLSEALIEDIIEAMIVRLNDIPAIRLKAVHILSKFIDFNNPDDPVKKELIDNLGDPNAKVRCAIVDGLGATNDVFSHIIGRCRDIDERVRISSLKKLATIPAQSFTIENRQYICKNGLKDRSKAVVVCVKETLLPKWLECYDSNYLKFLKALQLDSNEKEINNTILVSTLVMNAFFEFETAEKILEALYLKNKLIPLEQLTWESAFYWNTLITFFQQKELENYLEQLLPETVPFCDYIQSFCDGIDLENQSIWEQQTHFLILKQLIGIAVKSDLSDEASRRCLHSFFVKLLKYYQLNTCIIDEIVKYFEISVPNVNDRINFICNLISDIRNPLEEKYTQKELHEFENKIKQLKLQLKTLLEEQKEAIKVQEFLVAKQLEESINEVKIELEDISKKTEEEDNNEQQENKIMDEPVIKKCIDIIHAMLQSQQIIKLNPILISLKNELFKEIALFDNEEIQAKYFKCYGIISSLDKEISKENIQLFCLPLRLYKETNTVSKIPVITISIHCITDIIILYGADVLPIIENDFNSEENSSIDFEILFGRGPVTLNEVVDILENMMNDVNLDLREVSCESLIKLMVHKRIESATLFSKLFIKWLNPATAYDVRLRQLLGIFIECFSQLPDVEIQIEEAFIPTVRTICLAPDTSPLSNISKDELFKSLIKILNLRYNEDYLIHENIAMALCGEIQKDIHDVNKCNVHFARALLWLELRRDNETSLEDLLTLAEDIIIDVKDKNIIRYMNKFIYSLKHDTAD